MARIDVVEIYKPGSQGPSGKSAYDLAVLEGFRGTITEWLSSLKGQKGDKGENGKDGQDNVVKYNTFEHFPSTGDETKLYLGIAENELYTWDNAYKVYKLVNPLKIEIINCGDSNA